MDEKERNIISEIEFRIGIKQEALNQKVADVNVVFNTRDAEVFKNITEKDQRQLSLYLHQFHLFRTIS